MLFRDHALELVPQLEAGLVETFVRRATRDRLSGGRVVVGRHHPPIPIEAVSEIEPDMPERPTAEGIVNLVDTVQVSVVDRDAGKHFTEQALRPVRGPQQIGMNDAGPSGQIDDPAKLKPGSEEVGQPLDGEESWKDQLAGEP